MFYSLMKQQIMSKIGLIILLFASDSVIYAQDLNATSIQNIRLDTIQRMLPYDTTLRRIQQLEKDRKCLNDSAKNILHEAGIPFKNVFRYDFYGTAAALSLVNKPDNAENGSLQFYYNVTLNNKLVIDKFTWSFYFFNEYGYKKYFDSIGIKSDDNYNLRNNVQWNLYKNRIKLNADINIKSQIWKTYQYQTTSTNTTEKILYSSYFSPGYIMYSGGIAYNTKKGIVFELGMVSGKTTKIKNQEIYDTRHADNLYGLDKGEKKKLEFGLNLIITAPIIELRKNIYWETNSVFFTKNRTSGYIKQYTMDVNNAFHFLFLKHLRLTLRTKMIYDPVIQDKIFVSNQISFGFYLSNKMK
jgi:hypothetical protein